MQLFHENHLKMTFYIKSLDKLIQKDSFQIKNDHFIAEIWKIFGNRKFEGLEISVKSDRAVKSESFLILVDLDRLYLNFYGFQAVTNPKLNSK